MFQVASAKLSRGEHLQHIRQGVRKHAGFCGYMVLRLEEVGAN